MSRKNALRLLSATLCLSTAGTTVAPILTTVISAASGDLIEYKLSEIDGVEVDDNDELVNFFNQFTKISGENAVTDNGVVKLLKDIKLSTSKSGEETTQTKHTVKVKGTVPVLVSNFTLDLNGHTISPASIDSLPGQPYTKAVIQVGTDAKSGSLIIKDSDPAKKGKIFGTGESITGSGIVTYSKNGKVTLNGGTIEATGKVPGTNTPYKAVECSTYLSKEGNFVLDGGTVKGTLNTNSASLISGVIEDETISLSKANVRVEENKVVSLTITDQGKISQYQVVDKVPADAAAKRSIGSNNIYRDTYVIGTEPDITALIDGTTPEDNVIDILKAAKVDWKVKAFQNLTAINSVKFNIADEATLKGIIEFAAAGKVSYKGPENCFKDVTVKPSKDSAFMAMHHPSEDSDYNYYLMEPKAENLYLIVKDKGGNVVGNYGEDSLSYAFKESSIPRGGTIQLMKDIELTDTTIAIPKDYIDPETKETKGLTIDLNGHTLTINNSNNKEPGIVSFNGGSFILDSSADTAGKLIYMDDTKGVPAISLGATSRIVDKKESPDFLSHGSLTIAKNVEVNGSIAVFNDGSQLDVSGTVISKHGPAISGNGGKGENGEVHGPTTIKIHDGAVIKSEGSDGAGKSAAIYQPNEGTITIGDEDTSAEATGPTIEGAVGVLVRAGSVNVNKGTVKATGSEDVVLGDTDSNVPPAAIVVDKNDGYGSPEVNIEGGSFESTKKDTPSVVVTETNGNQTETAENPDGALTVNGGKYSDPVNPQYLNDDLRYELKDKATEGNTTPYSYDTKKPTDENEYEKVSALAQFVEVGFLTEKDDEYLNGLSKEAKGTDEPWDPVIKDSGSNTFYAAFMGGSDSEEKVNYQVSFTKDNKTYKESIGVTKGGIIYFTPTSQEEIKETDLPGRFTIKLSKEDQDSPVLDTRTLDIYKITYKLGREAQISGYKIGQDETEKTVYVESKNVDKKEFEPAVSGIKPGEEFIWEKEESDPDSYEITYTGSVIKTEYSITAETTSNGKVSLSKEKATAGEKITITATAGDGYEVDKVIVTNLDDNSSVAVTNNGDNTYDFDMPTGNVSVNVTFKSTEPEGPGTGGETTDPGSTGTGGTPGTGGTTGSGTTGTGDGDDSKDEEPTTVVTTNPDGSTTTTTTDPDTGVKTEVTEGKPDGSKETVVTQPDGSKETTREKADGNVTKVAEDKDGNFVFGSATVGKQAAENAKQNGTSVALDMPAIPADHVTEDVVLNVTVPAEAGETEVSIPVVRENPGSVAVLVDENGNESVIVGSNAKDGKITVPVSGNAKIIIKDNSKSFPDMPNYDKTTYPGSGVAYVSARGIFNGQGDGNFDLDGKVSRGMIARVFYNLAGKPDVSSLPVPEGVNVDWYRDAATWAASTGLMAQGSNFRGDDPLTREQLAMIIWRYEGKPEANGDLSAYSADDVASISSPEMRKAVTWAVGEHIIGQGSPINGQRDGSRGEIANMIYRHLANVSK